MRPHIALIHQNVKLPFIFEEAELLGIDITLVHAPSVTPPKDLPAVVHTVSLDIFKDEHAAIKTLLKWNEQRPFNGILTLFDGAITFTARAAAALGLYSIGENVALAVRDKNLMHSCFKKANVHCPNSIKMTNSQEIVQAKALKFPVIVKPASGFSSQGVIRVNHFKDLYDAVKDVEAINEETLAVMSKSGETDFSGIIIEEYIDGPEYAVESFVQDGRVYVLSIGYKGNCKGPYFEEGVYLAPAQLSETVKRSIVEQVKRSTLALGIKNGPTHTELRVRNEVEPYILEVGARIGGSGVSHFIVKHSTGINLARLTFEMTLGNAIDIDLPEEPKPIAVAGNYIIPVHGHGTITKIEGIEELRDLPEVQRIIQFLSPGDVVKPYPRFSGYPGFILTKHESYKDCEEFYQTLDEKISIHYDMTHVQKIK